MSAAPAAAPAEGEAPKKGSKKLIIIIAVVALLLVGGGAAAFLLMKKKPAEGDAAAAEEDSHGKVAEKPKDHSGHPPTFVPLDPFIVNLADRDEDRYAQIGITLQVEDPKVGEEVKNYMPAIRNAVLMILSHKSSTDLLSQEGKEKLAEEIRRESARAMGYEVEDPEDDEAASADEEAPKKKKKKKKRAELYNPIAHVQYSNFIIQ